MSLRASLSEYEAAFQDELFPALEEAPGPLPERYRRFVQVLEFVLVDAVVLPTWPGGPGRPPEDCRALARAFLAKAVFDVPTTRALIERLRIDGTLRRLCGWTRAGAVPSEATFSQTTPRACASATSSRRSGTRPFATVTSRRPASGLTPASADACCPRFGSAPLGRITANAVHAWFDRYSATAPGSANHALRTLKTILRYAVARARYSRDRHLLVVEI